MSCLNLFIIVRYNTYIMRKFVFLSVVFVYVSLGILCLAWADGGDEDSFGIEGAEEETVKVFITLLDEEVVQRKFGVFKKKVDAKRDISEKVNRGGGEVEHAYNNINVVSARVTIAQMEELERDPNVNAVERVGTIHTFLSQSVPIVNADDVWLEKIDGLNITGSGTTVCVLDTGIDDTHPDFSGRIVDQYCYCTASDYGSGGCCPNNQTEDTDANDDHGHGTHVSGIVAASGGRYGVAKGANIIAIRIANGTGVAEDSDLVSGIDWCIDNATKYNISVISLSMGGGSYSDYCDGDGGLSAIKAAIDAAVAHNISFVAATGNEHSSTSIAAPACLFNATRVGGTTKSDVIDTAYSNRGANFAGLLLAPGSSISSTCNGGGYCVMSGTSMATPHVSGAMALLWQAYKLKYGVGPEPKYIEDILNDTGKLIADGANSYARIDVLAGVYEIAAPDVFLLSPVDGNYFSNTTVVFEYVPEDEGNIVNCSLYTNKSGWGRETYNESMIVNGGVSNFSFDFSYDGAYIWNVECVDDDSMGGFNSTNRTVFVDGTLPFVEVLSPEYANYSFYPMLNFSFNESNPDACFYSLNGGDNVTVESCENGTVLSSLAQGLNNVSLCMNDSAGNVNCSYVDFGFDSVAPVVYVIEPLNVTYNYSEIIVNITTNEDEDACFYDIGYGNVTLNGSKRYYNGTIFADEGVNWLRVYCNDSVGNVGVNDSLFFTVDSMPKILILSPVDGDYFSDTTVVFEYVPEDEGSIVNCSLYTNRSGWGREMYNESVVVKGVVSNFSFDFSYDGDYIWNVGCVDDDSRIGFNSTNRTVFVDGTLPFVEILSPAEGNYSFYPMLNFSFNESNPDACFYSLNGGDNVTVESCENGTVLSSLAQGLNNVSLCMNDSAGNVNCSGRDFWYDSIAPDVNVAALLNVTYSYSDIFVDVSVDEDVFACFYDAGHGNVSMNGSVRDFNATVSAGEGVNWLRVYCNDSAGNVGVNDSLFFTVDTIAPEIDVVAPLNGTYNDMWVWVNVSTDGCYWCGVSLNGSGNVSLLNESVLVSDDWYLNLSVGAEGVNNVSVYCNDSAGNVNFSFVEFVVNTTLPAVSLDFPQDGGNVTYGEVMFNYTASGVDIVNCTLYGNFSGEWGGDVSNSTSVDGIEVNLSSGVYLWNVMCVDYFSNAAFAGSNYTVVVDFDAPDVSVVVPLNGSGLASGTKWVWVNVSADEDAVCRYNLSNSSFDFDDDGAEFNVTAGLNFSFNYSLLSDGGEYTVYYKCRDLFSNVNDDAVSHVFSVNYPCVDNDGDGYGVGVGCLGTDCDDSNPSIHTGCGSSSSGGCSVVVIFDDAVDEEVVNDTDVEEAIVENESVYVVNETNRTDEVVEPETMGQIYADILELEDVVHELKSGNKISENVSEEYLLRLSEVMELYMAGEFEEAEDVMDEIRISLVYENETAVVDEDEVGIDYGFLMNLGAIVVVVMGFFVIDMILTRNKCPVMKYIKLCLEKGFSHEDIKRKMVEGGWSEDVVDKAMKKVKKK